VGNHRCRRVSGEFDRAFDRRRSLANLENLPAATICIVGRKNASAWP
jgi:hypothetical protein